MRKTDLYVLGLRMDLLNSVQVCDCGFSLAVHRTVDTLRSVLWFAQFPDQHPSQKTWLWCTLRSSLCGAAAANAVNRSVPPEDTPGEGGWTSAFLQPPPEAGIASRLSALRQTPRVAPRRAKPKPARWNLPELRPVSCHQPARQPASSRAAGSPRSWELPSAPQPSSSHKH